MRRLTSKHQIASRPIPLQCKDDRFLFNLKKGSWILNCKNFLPPWKIPVNLLSDSGQQMTMETNPQVFIKWKNLCLQFFQIEEPLIPDWVFPKTLIWSSSFYEITSKHSKFYRRLLVCKPILQAKWSNKQKTKVLCIKVHFIHFYPSIIFKIQMCPTLNKGGVLCMGAPRRGGGGSRGGFIFLSANRRAQGALLLFLSNYRGTGKNFFSVFPVS